MTKRRPKAFPAETFAERARGEFMGAVERALVASPRTPTPGGAVVYDQITDGPYPPHVIVAEDGTITQVLPAPLGELVAQAAHDRALAEATGIPVDIVVAVRGGPAPAGYPDEDPVPWGAETPPGWRCTARAGNGAEYRVPGGMKVIATAGTHSGERWLHISCSFPLVRNRLPSWPDLVLVRDRLAPGLEMYQVAPPPERYVNVTPGVLHLWGSLDRPAGILPAFEWRASDGTLHI